MAVSCRSCQQPSDSCRTSTVPLSVSYILRSVVKPGPSLHLLNQMFRQSRSETHLVNLLSLSASHKIITRKKCLTAVSTVMTASRLSHRLQQELAEMCSTLCFVLGSLVYWLSLCQGFAISTRPFTRLQLLAFGFSILWFSTIPLSGFSFGFAF